MGAPDVELRLPGSPMPVVGFPVGRCSAFPGWPAASGCAFTRRPRSAPPKTIPLPESGSEPKPAGALLDWMSGKTTLACCFSRGGLPLKPENGSARTESNTQIAALFTSRIQVR